jgi:hypothetical protein
LTASIALPFGLKLFAENSSNAFLSEPKCISYQFGCQLKVGGNYPRCRIAFVKYRNLTGQSLEIILGVKLLFSGLIHIIKNSNNRRHSIFQKPPVVV